jgi:hypothetical protein
MVGAAAKVLEELIRNRRDKTNCIDFIFLNKQIISLCMKQYANPINNGE